VGAKYRFPSGTTRHSGPRDSFYLWGDVGFACVGGAQSYVAPSSKSTQGAPAAVIGGACFHSSRALNVHAAVGKPINSATANAILQEWPPLAHHHFRADGLGRASKVIGAALLDFALIFALFALHQL